MNSRIQELIKQCTDIVEIVNPDTNITHHREFFDKEKFAELIVRECIQVAIEQKQWVEKQQPTFNYDDDKWDRARIQQSQHIVDKIREHFGVEE